MVWAGGERAGGSGRGRHRQGLEPPGILGEAPGGEFRDEEISENEAIPLLIYASLLCHLALLAA